jgi:hypothetical protein
MKAARTLWLKRIVASQGKDELLVWDSLPHPAMTLQPHAFGHASRRVDILTSVHAKAIE